MMATVYMSHTQTPQGIHIQFVEGLQRLAMFERDCRAAGMFTQQVQITAEDKQNDALVLAISPMPFGKAESDQVYQDCVNWLVSAGHATPPSGTPTTRDMPTVPLQQAALICCHVGCEQKALYTIRLELRPVPNAKPAITEIPLGFCAKHNDVTFEELMPDAQWRSLRAAFAAQGFAMPKRQYSNIVIVPIA